MLLLKCLEQNIISQKVCIYMIFLLQVLARIWCVVQVVHIRMCKRTGWSYKNVQKDRMYANLYILKVKGIQPGDRIIPEMAKGDLSPNNTTKSKLKLKEVIFERSCQIWFKLQPKCTFIYTGFICFCMRIYWTIWLPVCQN